MVGAAPVALNGDVPENLPVISRPRDGAMLGGVCAGLARRWQLDPNLLRIALVVLSVFGGLGLVAYGSGLL
ncbi:MAG: PspC domain-containing protein, partial [Actinobacteria bacterium]|nr:PspC domain-containing protein [Actinomycetota bacterium]